LSNAGFDMSVVIKPWVRFVVGIRKEIVVALDWTDFEKDDHTTLCAYLVTRHGRSTPLAWKTVKKSTLKGTRNDHEYSLVEVLHEAIDADVEVVLPSPLARIDPPLLTRTDPSWGLRSSGDAGRGRGVSTARWLAAARLSGWVCREVPPARGVQSAARSSAPIIARARRRKCAPRHAARFGVASRRRSDVHAISGDIGRRTRCGSKSGARSAAGRRGRLRRRAGA
jgi:hypothetical protein